MLPSRVLTPGTLQVSHIGLEGGLHEQDLNLVKVEQMISVTKFGAFHSKVGEPLSIGAPKKTHNRGYGGWGHPADHEHCLNLFNGGAGAKKEWIRWA